MTTRREPHYTELWLVGTPAEVAMLTTLAKRSGTLVHATAPTPMGGTDTRQRVYLKLRFPTRRF